MTSEEFSVESLVTARLIELVDHRTPWHRSLWQAGSVLALKEVLEYADGVRSRAIRAEGLDYVCTSSSMLIRRDLGLGTGPLRDLLLEILAAGSKKGGVTNPAVAESLRQLIPRVENEYLTRWNHALANEQVTQDRVELMARSVIAHMLDAGFARDHLHGWLLRGIDTGQGLPELMSKAMEMFARPPNVYQVFVPFTRLPHEVSALAGTRFLTHEELIERLRTEGWPDPNLRKGAGTLVFQVEAREPKAAIAAAEIEVRRLSARVAIGLPSSAAVDPAGKGLAVPASRPRWQNLRPRQRDLFLSSMVRHRLLLPSAREATLHALDDAFELLATVEATTSWASVATLWAAVEGLLARPSDSGVTAADRLASVVAGGFVRAELTQLVDRLELGEDDLGELLRSPLTAAEKMDTVMGYVERREDLALDEPADAAAVARLRALSESPADVMDRVKHYFCDAFRRLFNQRNLLLHGGRFDSVVLPATMRTLPPLVAAGLDRLVHAAVQEPPTDPFGLAARAENEIALLDTEDARALSRLLD